MFKCVDVVTPVSEYEDFNVVVVIIPEFILVISFVAGGDVEVILVTARLLRVESLVTLKLVVVVNPVAKRLVEVTKPAVIIPVGNEILLDHKMPLDPLATKNCPADPLSFPI